MEIRRKQDTITNLMIDVIFYLSQEKRKSDLVSNPIIGSTFSLKHEIYIDIDILFHGRCACRKNVIYFIVKYNSIGFVNT